MDLQFTEHPKYYNFWKPCEDGEVNFSLNTIIERAQKAPYVAKGHMPYAGPRIRPSSRPKF